jgi:hypothetical protein
MQNLYLGICSSSIYLFTVSNIDPQLEFVTRMGTLLKGFKRTIVEQRVAAGETLEEGKAKKQCGRGRLMMGQWSICLSSLQGGIILGGSL